jgi:opacity protein-like surface antigen
MESKRYALWSSCVAINVILLAPLMAQSSDPQSSERRHARMTLTGSLVARPTSTEFTDAWSAQGSGSSGYYGFSSLDASIEDRYSGRNAPSSFGLTADFWITDRLAFGVEAFRLTTEMESASKLKLSLIQEYDVFGTTYVDTYDGEAEGVIEDLDHRETVANLYVKWSVPLSEKIRLEFSGGPSLFGIRQRVVADIIDYTYCDEDESEYRFASTNCQVMHRRSKESDSSYGFNLGAGVDIMLQERMSLAAQIRYARGKDAKIAGMSPGSFFAELGELFGSASDARTTIPVKTGGLYMTLGLRVAF